MGVFSSEASISSTVSANRLFKAMVLEADVFMPKILSQAIKSIHVEGDGGPGTILNTVFVQGLPYTYGKNKVEVLDMENLTYKYSMIEGDVLPEKYEKVTTELKFLPAGGVDGGSVLHSTTQFYTVGDAHVSDEELEDAKVKGLAAFNAIEAYLQANPNVCN